MEQLIINLFSFFGFLTETISFHKNKRVYIVLCIIATFFYSVPLIWTSAWSGLVVNIANGIRDIAMLFGLPIIPFIVITVFLNIVFAESEWAVLLILGTLLHGYAIMGNEQRIRFCMIFEQILWMSYSLHYGLYLMASFNVLNIISTMIAYYRGRKQNIKAD